MPLRDPGAYPADVALLDIEAVLALLDLGSIDLVGYSLGARVLGRACGAGPEASPAGAGRHGL